MPPAFLGDLQHVPRLSSRVLLRPALLSRLDGPAPLVVLRAPGGTGKTTLMAQWAVATAPGQRGTLMWIEADDGTRTRTGFWMRVLGRLHARELIDDRTLYREMASIADRPDTLPATMCRVLGEHGGAVTLLLDDVGAPAPGSYWDEVSADLREVLLRVPTVRVVVAGRFPTALESAQSRSVVDTQVITEEQLALSAAEIATLVDLTLPSLAGDPRRERILAQLGAGTAERRLGAVRWMLGVLERALEQHPGAEDLDLDALLVEASRHELASLPGDPVQREFLRTTALAPLVDVDLARRLTGREDAEELLSTLEQIGVGQWLHAADGTSRTFRYGRHLRRAAVQDAAPVTPQRRRELHAMIAHWLAEVQQEPIAALEHALQAEDIGHVEQLLMQAYPVSSEDSVHITRLLRAVPATRLHLHPLLALWHAMMLNRSPSTQSGAVPFFLSASLVGRVRASSVSPLERAVRRGLESAVHRMLGRLRPMRDLARRALAELDEAVEDPGRDRRLDGIVMTAISQSATSLFYADEPAAALAARDLQTRFADSRQLCHQHNVAQAHTALIHAVQGDLARSREALARIDAEDWPHSWRESYHDSPEIIARAWAALNDARPADALAQLDRLDAHVATIEHWDLIATARALALALAGRVEEGEAHLRRAIEERVTDRTLPSSHRRLETVQAMLRLLAGGVPAPPRRSASLREDPAAAALAVPRVLAEGRPEEAVELLARAELGAGPPLARMLTALAGVHLARRTSLGLDLAGHGLRLHEIVSVHDLRMPLVLLSAGDREAVLEALARSGREQTAALLGEVLDRVPLTVPEADPAPAPQLSARERDVLLLLAETERRSEIAARLFVSVNTVKAHLRTLYAKLEATSREEALAAAIRLGLLRDRDRAGDGSGPAEGRQAPPDDREG